MKVPFSGPQVFSLKSLIQKINVHWFIQVPFFHFCLSSKYFIIDLLSSVFQVFVRGRHVKVALSRFAMELILSSTVVFFYEAHLACDAKHLESHFSSFGHVSESNLANFAHIV